MLEKTENTRKILPQPRYLVRLRLILFLIFAVTLLIADIIFFSLSINKPYMGIVLSNSSGLWQVESVDLNGIAYQQGMSTGEIPIEVNGQPAAAFLEKYTGAGEVYGAIIENLTVSDATGRIESANLQSSFPSTSAVAELTMWFITCLTFWSIGFYVFLRRPDKAAPRLMTLAGLFFGLTLSTVMAGERIIPFAAQISACSLAISPAILLHFFLVLPAEREWLHNKPLLYLIYLPAAITIALFPIVGFENGQPLPWFRNVRLMLAVLTLMAVGAVVIYNYVRAGSPRTKQQMKIMLIGGLSSLVPFLVLNFLYTEVWKQNGVPFGVHVLFISLIPVSMGYAVITQRLLDIDIIIRRGVIYGTITVIMALILGLAIFFILSYRTAVDIPEQVILALVLGGTATFLFGPVSKGVESVVDRLFYKDRYDYRQIIQNLSNSLNSVKGFSETSRLIVGTTVSTLNLSGAALFVKTLSGPFEISASQGSYVSSDTQNMLLSLISGPEMIKFPESASSVIPEVEYLVPFVTGDIEVGILCLSQKANRQKYSSNDVYLIQGISLVAASAIRGAMLSRDVSMRDTFITIASHELRTPLTTIIGFSDLLMRRDPAESTRKQWAHRIYDSGKRITTMVDNLLNITRIQSGKAALKIEPVNLAEVLNEQLEMVKESTDKHSFTLNLDNSLPRVLIDRDKFGQVISNLLSNAVKYSPEGGCITISAGKKNGHKRVIVSVTDEGMGISPDDQASLFTTFHRIQRPETRGIQGSGLGLYIAKEWTEAMQGEIWLKSELNKGTTFFVAVPEDDS